MNTRQKRFGVRAESVIFRLTSGGEWMKPTIYRHHFQQMADFRARSEAMTADYIVCRALQR
jgi:hypothetical protein